MDLAATSARRALGGAALVVALAATLYANSLHVPFLFDDLPNIERNPFLKVTHLDAAALQAAAFRSPAPRPVANLSFALNHYFSGGDVTAYHLVNVAVHAANGVLVYLLALWLLELSGRLPDQRLRLPAAARPAAALLTALFFVAHPLQTQSVTYVVQRMTGLAVFFMLIALLGFLLGRSATSPGRRRLTWAGAVVAWLLALGCKPIAAILPFTVLLLEFFFFRDMSPAWRRRGAWLLASAAGVLLVLAYAFSDGFAAFENYADRDFTPWQRLLTQPRVVVFYLSLIAWPLPSRLNLNHAIETSTSLLAPWTTLASIALLAGLLALAIAGARRQRLASFCVLWFFLHLAIESSVVPLEMIYEHRLYWPLVGVALGASYALFAALGRRRALAVGVAGVLVACLGVGTVLRNRTWHDAVTLWSDVVAKSPDDTRALQLLGYSLASSGREAEAIQRYREALRIDPDYGPAHNGLAVVLEGQGQLDEAVAHYAQAVRSWPEVADFRTNQGLLLLRTGRTAEGVDALEAALRLDPGHAKAHVALGNLRGSEGRIEAAIEHFEAALRRDPDLAAAHSGLGVALARQGRFALAEHHLRVALRREPAFADAHAQLGAVLAQQQRYAAAAEHFRAALRIDPEHAAAHRYLAALPGRDRGR